MTKPEGTRLSRSATITAAAGHNVVAGAEICAHSWQGGHNGDNIINRRVQPATCIIFEAYEGPKIPRKSNPQNKNKRIPVSNIHNYITGSHTYM